MNWLIRGIGNRNVIGDLKMRLKDDSIAAMRAEAQAYNVSTAFIVYSADQNDPKNPILFSDGSVKAITFDDTAQSRGIDPKKFDCLPLIWKNDSVSIFQLLPVQGQCITPISNWPNF